MSTHVNINDKRVIFADVKAASGSSMTEMIVTYQNELICSRISG